MAGLTIGVSGEITLPDEVRSRYGFTEGSLVRLVETQAGILLVPETGGAMNDELTRELEGWQALSLDAWKLFPYEE